MITKSVLQRGNGVDLKIKDVEISEALALIFNDQPLDYQVTDKLVSVKLKEKTFFEKIVDAFAAISIHGKVVDEKGLPIPGATILLKDRSQVTTTDVIGNFWLQKVNDKGVLIFSSIGFLTKELNVKLDIGTTTRRLSIRFYKSSERERPRQAARIQPDNRYGRRVPGVFITQSAGYASAPVNVMIRGQNSLTGNTNNSTAPSYIINGIPFGSISVE